MDLRKDQTLDELADIGNVAQFVGFLPRTGEFPEQSFCRVWGYAPNHRFSSHADALRTLLANSPDRSINLRSYSPASPRSREFVYGIKDADVALEHLVRLNREGLHVIVNETVDIADGGVSGVIEGGVIEFAPDDTPRCVEKPGMASFALDEGLHALELVYGFLPQLPNLDGARTEFSIHPQPRGYKRTHTLLWERDSSSLRQAIPELSWPNRFSRLIGDKVFGLLVAHLTGALVPLSLVISRRLRPFQFGESTRSFECWLRTCPTEQIPGRYTTVNRWIDPFALLRTEDPCDNSIASIISQSAVRPLHSGAAIALNDGELHIEGTTGKGDEFMLGRVQPRRLPAKVIDDIRNVDQLLRQRLGHVRFEWVHDGERVWIVQLHKGATKSTSTTLVPGDPSEWFAFKSEQGLEALREFLNALPVGAGVLMEGEVGLTSHLADLVRKSGRPTRLVRLATETARQLTLDFDM